jgi:hypothetical protein
MTVTEPTDPSPRSAIGLAFRRIGNPGQASPYCMCGRCLAGDAYSDTELALDASMTHMLDMVGIIQSSTPDPHPSTWISLNVLHDLVGEMRALLCVQRQTTRALAARRGS